MRKRLLVLILLVGLLLPALPMLLTPEPVGAADYTTFHQIEPAAQITISSDDTWVTINASTYGVPLGATGILYIAKNWEGSGGDDCAFGIRKNGSSDNRINPLWEHTPTWGVIGVDENCLFQVYKGSETNNFGIWINGYTTVGVTFFTNGIDKTPVNNGWTDTDCSTEAPGAIGLIFEVVGPSRGETMFNFGIQKKGCTSGFTYNAPDHLAPGIIVGCDTNQISQIYVQAVGYYEFYLIGYVYDGAYFYTTPVAQGPTVAGVWTDLTTALPAGSVMGFYEFRGSGSAYAHDLRPNGSAWTFGGLDNRHCWAYAGCDGAGLVEGYVAHTSIGYWLVGYATPGFYNVSTHDATDVDSDSAVFHGTVTDDNGETVELRGFQWGLTETPTWQWYETGSSEFWINPSSTNYMYNAAGGYLRLGQRITLAANLTSLTFYLKRVGSPTGNITYCIDTAAGANIWSEVLCDASVINNVTATWYKIDFDAPLTVVGDHRLYTDYVGGDAANYIEHGYRSADVDDGVYTRDGWPAGGWSESPAQESGIKFDYEIPGNYGEGSYSHTVTGLDDNTQYYYRAYMVTSGGTYYGRWIPFGTANQPMVTTLPASSVATTTARLNSLLDADGDEPVTIRFGWGNSTETAIEDYQFSEELPDTYTEGEHPYLDISNLDASSTYYFRVEAENVNGSDLGDELSFTTGSLTDTPANFRGTPHATTIDLSWNVLSGASTYLVRYAFGGFVTNITQGFLAYAGSASSTTHEGLTPGVTHYYTLWGVSGGYYSPPAYLALTTSAGSGAPGTYTPPTEVARWLVGTDYTNVSGLGFIYDIVNGTADSVDMPRGTAWFILWVGLSVIVGFAVYVKSQGKLMVGTMVMTALMVLGWRMMLVPFWIPLIGGILIFASFMGHKETAKG